MAKRKKVSDGPDRPAAGDNHTVYFDTSLDTHLVFTVSDSDTVANMKERIVHEHLQCFPALGKIMINALKVQRKEYFYHLSDSMPVRCAFEGVTESWFLYVDASSLKGQNSLESLSFDHTSNEKGVFKHPKYDLANSGKAGKNDVKNWLICATERPCQSSCSYSTLRSGTLGTLRKDVNCKEDSEIKMGNEQFNSVEEALKHNPCKKKQKGRRTKDLKEHNNKAGSVQTSHVQEVTGYENALVIYDGSNKEAGAEFFPEENPLCIVPEKVKQPKVHASTGIATNGIASAAANGKSNTSVMCATNGSKKSKRTKKHQSRDQGIHASPTFHDSSNADKYGAEIGSEEKILSNDKNKNKRKLTSDHDISTQDASFRQNCEVIAKDFENSTPDERPKKRSKKSVAVNPNLSGLKYEICKGKIATDKGHSAGDCKVVLLEKFDPSHQNDANGYVKDMTSSAEFLGTNKGKESEKSNHDKKLKKGTKRLVVVQSDALVMDNDCQMKNKTDEKIEAQNEKDPKIMLSEEVDPELQIKKAVGVKELENTASEQKKNVKTKKSVTGKPSPSVMVNDNLQTESSLPGHTDKNEKDHKIMPSKEIGLEMQIEKAVVVKELESIASGQREKVKVKKSVKPGISVMVNDNLQTESSLPNQTDKNEKDHNIVISEEVGAELQFGKTVGVKELENTASGQRKKVKVKKSVKPGTLAMVNDNLQTESFLPDHTNKNEKDHKIMPSEEVETEMQIEKAVGVKELEKVASEQKKKVKVKKSVKPDTLVMVNDNLQTESFLPDHSNKNEKDHKTLPSEEVEPEMQIEKAVGVKELEKVASEQKKKVKVKKSVKPDTSVMVNDNLQTESFLPDHSNKNEKEHKILPSEEVGPDMQIEKAVGVKELENVASSVQRKNVKVKKSVKPATSVMVNDNLQTESFLPNNTDTNEKDHNIMLSEELDPELQIGKTVGSEQKKIVKVKKSVKPGTSVLVNDNLQTESSISNHTDNNEKEHNMMLDEEFGTERQIGKAVGVKELENTASEQRKKVKSKKSVIVKPGALVMVNDNLQTESSLLDHTDKTYEKEELQREDDHDRQIKELDFAEPIDTNKVREPVKSNTEKTKRKRSNKLVAVKPATTNVNPCSDVSVPNYTSKSDERRELPYDDEAMLSERGADLNRKGEESFLASQVTEAPEENPKESEKVKGRQVPIDSIAKSASIKDEKMGRKMKKHKVLNVKRHPDLPLEDQKIASQELNPQPDTLASDPKINSKSLKSDPKNQLAGGVQEDTNSTTADLSSSLPDTAINSNPKSESISVNFKEYFVPSQVVEKTNDGSEVTKGKKTSSLGLSSSNIQFQGSSSKVDTKSMSKSISASPKLHQIKSVPEETGWTGSNGLEMRTPALASRKKSMESSRVPISRSETSERHTKNLEKSNMKASRSQDVEVSKASRNNIGEIINSSQNKTSLFARSGSIFEDASSESSKDDNGEETSDSSTKSPSDTSSSSSSGYSNASNLRSNVADSLGTKGKESGKKNISETRTPGSKRPSLDMILKSSSRFKKARLIAIESQHEEDSVEFVPETEP